MTGVSTTLASVDPRLLAALGAAAGAVRSRASDRLAAAHDASHYLFTPQAIVAPETVDEVAAVLAAARDHGVPLTFRSGGTSLSGQAGTDGILVDTRRGFRSVSVLDGGARVRTGPGVTVRAVNTRLARHGRKLGPDPASEIACTIGGVIANNSSGMTCGTTRNTYRTLESATLVLPGGTVLDTALPDADARLAAAEPALHAGLLALRDRVRGDPGLVAEIRRQHSIKNTMGYGLNSLLDHDTAAQILLHLVIGSEGTLAFVADATFRTVELPTRFATGLLIFRDLAAATAALPALVATGVGAIELLDATSLRVAQRDPEAPEDLRDLVVEGHAALLVEIQEASPEEFAARQTVVDETLRTLDLEGPAAMSTDAVRRAALWHLRKGLFTLVAGSRPSGTTALLEDIAVPVERLLDTCVGLTTLFELHGYEDSVIFGHAKDGNVHFMISERFDDPGSLVRYEAFTHDMVELVLGHGGTLKAEHGTGRIMAPFVRRQYGDELYEVMREIKHLVDPLGLLNPGVLLSDDPDVHLQGLKTSPTVEAEVDRCVECGYCEPVCPSKDLTITPRERIVLRREIARAEEAGDETLARQMREEYRYDGVETCAVDGMCQTACPVLINTGDLVRRLRSEDRGRLEQAGWKAAAQSWGAASRAGSVVLSVLDKVPAAVPASASAVARALLGADSIPQYSADLPAGGSPRRIIADEDPDFVYFSSCTTTMFGPAGGGDGVSESFLRLVERAGMRAATPSGIRSLCCGTPWKSKGLTDGYAVMKDAVARALDEASRGGELPVVCDASSCSEGLEVLLEAAGALGIRVVDAVQFAADEVLPRLAERGVASARIPSVTVHPTCSSTRLGTNPALFAVAGAVADAVHVPDDWGCCAFAGDRGMLHPELTASATAAESRSVAAVASGAHASLNRTCEIGMTRATGEPYRHILELLDAVTTGAAGDDRAR